MCLTLEKFFPREGMATAITVWPSRTPGALTYQITLPADLPREDQCVPSAPYTNSDKVESNPYQKRQTYVFVWPLVLGYSMQSSGVRAAHWRRNPMWRDPPRRGFKVTIS